MRKLTLAILVSLLPVVALGQGTIDDLPAASSLGASDMLACAQGTTITNKCSLDQVKDWLITYFDTEAEMEGVLTDVANFIISTEIDTEAELEALLSDVSNMLVSTELDTEAELEALLGDVTDVLTNNDTITADAANADTIDAITEIAAALRLGSDLKLATGNAGSTDECAKWNVDGDLVSAGAPCGTGGGDSLSIDSGAVVDPDFVSTGDVDFVDTSNTITANLNIDVIDATHMANADHGDISWSNGFASLDDSTVDSPQINDDSILEVDLNADNVAVADDILTFSVTADNFAWQTPTELSIGLTRQAATDCTAETGGATDEQCHEADDNKLYICESGPCNGSGWIAYAGTGATTETGLESDLGDTTNVLTDNDASITFDGAIDLITSANGDIDFSPNGTGEVNVNSALNTQATAAPTITFKDSDSIADPADDNATISGNLTDTGDGTEDMDVLFQQQVAGTPTDFLAANADGVGDARIVLPDSSIGPDEILATGQTDGYALLYESTGDTVVWGAAAGGAFNDGSDPVVLYTTTKKVEIGDGAGTLTGKLEIGGDADVPQLVVEGHSTQTSDLVVFQNDADTEVFAVDNTGITTIGAGTGTITGAAGGVDLVLGASDVATIGDGGTTDYVNIDENGVTTFVGAASLAVPNGATPTTDATAEIALDTTITDHQPLIQYYDGAENMTVIAIDTAQLPATDNEIVKYDAGTDKFVLEADAGAAGGDSVSIDSVAVVDPDFVSTADIDFIDTSNTVTADINADAVEESHLNAVGAPTDEYCLTYEQDTTNFAWQTCGAGGGDSVSIDSVGVVDPDFVSTGDIDFVDTSNTVTANINAGSIIETDLNEDSGTPTDEDILTYDSTGANFNWVAQSTVAAGTAAALAADPTDCGANEFADAIAASGNLTCNAIVDADVPDTITIDLATTATTATTANAGDSATAFFSSGEIENTYLPDVDALTLAGSTDHYVLQATGATTYEFDWPIVRYHATDCAGLTDGEQGDVCWEADANTLYVCETATCNAAGWTAATAAGDGVGYDTVEEADTPLTQRANLNFLDGTRATMSCADDVDTTDCTVEAVATLSSYTDDLSHVEESTTVTDNADGMDITLSTYDITVALDPSEVANQAGDLADLVPYEDVTDGGIHHMTFTQVQTLVADGTGTDDQVASEVPFTPDDNGEWGTPPSEVDAALEDLAPRVTDNDAKVTESTTVTDNADGMDITLSTYDIAVALDPSEVLNQAPDLADLVPYEDVTDGGIHHATWTQIQTLVDTTSVETAADITMGGDISSTANTAQVDDVQSATTNLEAADNDTTQVASTSFVQQEINNADGTNLTCASGVCNVDDAFLLLAGDSSSGNYTLTGDWDFSGGGIEIENGITPPACTEGQLYLDTDATAGQQLMACDAGTFVVQGDGGGAPGADSIGTSELDDGADTPLSGEYIRVDTVDQAGIEYRTDAEVLADIGGAASGANSDITSITGLTTDLAVEHGGTGAGTFTDGGILLGNAAGAIQALGVATNGQIPIGDGTTDPQLAVISPTTNEIDVTNGAGSIQIGIVTSPTLDGSNFTGVAAGAYDAASIDGDDIATSLAGDYLTLTADTPDTLDVDVELTRDSKCIYVEDPAVEDLDGYFQFGHAVTIDRVWCETDTLTTTLNIENDDGTAADVLTSDIVCDSGEQTSCASGCDVNTISGTENAVAQYDELNLSISATGAANKVSVCVHYTIDDA